MFGHGDHHGGHSGGYHGQMSDKQAMKEAMKFAKNKGLSIIVLLLFDYRLFRPQSNRSSCSGLCCNTPAGWFQRLYVKKKYVI